MKIKRKKLFFIVFILLLIIIIGVFLWLEYKQKSASFLEYIGNYTIEENSEGRFIKNEEYGLSFKVPDDWTIKNYDKGGIGIFDPTVEFNEYGGFIESIRENGGCAFGVEIRDYEKVNPESTTDLEWLKNIIKMIKEDEEFSPHGNDETMENELIMVDGKEALRTVYFRDKDKEEDYYLESEVEEAYIKVEIPIENTIYSFNSSTIFLERCIEHFNEILSTVRINK